MDNETIHALLVEDNPGDARLVEEMLSDAGQHSVNLEHADKLSGGLKRLNKNSIDVILLDLKLPDSEGLDTFTEMHARAPELPIIVLSGLGDEKVAVEAVRNGAQDYLVKGDVSEDLLIRSIRYAIERKRIQESSRIKERAIEWSLNPVAMADLEGNLTYANPAFLKLWGIENRAEVRDRPTSDFWYGGLDAPQVAESMQEDGCWSGKVRGNSQDGSTLDLQLSASIVKDELDRELCVVLSFLDVTELSQLRRRLKEEHSFAGIVGRSKPMQQLFDTIRELSQVDVPVLIQGESGTGKELVAGAVHNTGPRADSPFVAVNCGALPEGVLESELFGHVEGAFTGATRDRKGRFELADGGTIFLDEIAELPANMQVKLLRVLQEGTFKRVGGEKNIDVDARVISATNKDLQTAVDDGNFRDDLYYRLCVVPVHLPPVRERRQDIPLLARHALKKALDRQNRDGISISDDAMETLVDYEWPGNVREIENALQYAVLKCKDGEIQPSHLPPALGGSSKSKSKKSKRGPKRKLDIKSVREALKETDGNKSEAARRLGVGRATLYRFLSDSDTPSLD